MRTWSMQQKQIHSVNWVLVDKGCLLSLLKLGVLPQVFKSYKYDSWSRKAIHSVTVFLKHVRHQNPWDAAWSGFAEKLAHHNYLQHLFKMIQIIL